MNGSPTVDCFVVNGKGTFRRRKNDFSSTVDGAFVLESSTVDGVLVDRKGTFRRRKNDFSSTVDGAFVLESQTVDGVFANDSVQEDFSERTVGMKPFSSAFTAIKFCVCNCEVVLLTKSMGNLTFSFSLSQSLVAMTLSGTVVTWLLRGHMWCVDSVGFLQGTPSDPLRGPMSKFLVRSHSHAHMASSRAFVVRRLSRISTCGTH